MIIDTHVHFFDPSRPQGVPWPEPDDDLLYRTVLPEHYKAVAKPEGVTGVIVIEASEWVEDNQWVLDLAAEDPFIVALVGHLIPYSADFAGNLDRFAANPLFRGLRMRNGYWEDVERRDYMQAMEQLAARDLEVDVNLSHEELDGVYRVARRLPELRIVINHIAHGRPINGKSPNPHWADAMREGGELPNVFCKVSALAHMTETTPAPSDVEFYTPALDVLWEAFGEDRLVYGSNWPNVEAGAPYATEQRIVETYFKGKGESVAEKFFWRNSKAAYKWVERT